MNVYQHVEGRIAALLHELQAAGKLPGGLAIPAVEVEAPRVPSHGALAPSGTFQ